MPSGTRGSRAELAQARALPLGTLDAWGGGAVPAGPLDPAVRRPAARRCARGDRRRIRWLASTACTRSGGRARLPRHGRRRGGPGRVGMVEHAGGLTLCRHVDLDLSGDASQFDEFTTHKKNTIRPLVRQMFWRPGSRAEVAYDTLDAVLALGVATEAGLCMNCGGKRLHPKCSCPPSSLDLTETLSALSADAAVSPAPAVALSRRKREARGASA